MKRLIILLLSIVALSSCEKEKSIYYCRCSNGFTTHYSSERKISVKVCADKEREINDTSSIKVTCKFD